MHSFCLHHHYRLILKLSTVNCHTTTQNEASHNPSQNPVITAFSHYQQA